MLVSAFGSGNVDTPTIVGDHERYTINIEGQKLSVHMDTVEPTKIHSITVGDVKIPSWSLSSQDIVDMEDIAKNDIPNQLAVAQKRPQLEEAPKVEVAEIEKAETLSEPPESSLIDQFEQSESIQDQRAKVQEGEEREARFNKVSRKLVKTFRDDGYVLRNRSVVDGHEQYSLTNGDQDIVINMEANDPLMIASMKVGDLDILLTNFKSRKIMDIDLNYSEEIPNQIRIAEQGSPLVPGIDSDPAPVAGIQQVNAAELNALLDQNPQEPKNAPPVVAQGEGPTNAPPVLFPDEDPPAAPLTEKQLQAEFDTLLQDKEPKGPDVVGAN